MECDADPAQVELGTSNRMQDLLTSRMKEAGTGHILQRLFTTFLRFRIKIKGRAMMRSSELGHWDER